METENNYLIERRKGTKWSEVKSAWSFSGAIEYVEENNGYYRITSKRTSTILFES